MILADTCIYKCGTRDRQFGMVVESCCVMIRAARVVGDIVTYFSLAFKAVLPGWQVGNMFELLCNV